MKKDTRRRAAAFVMAVMLTGSALQLPEGVLCAAAKEAAASAEQTEISENSLPGEISGNSISGNDISGNGITEDMPEEGMFRDISDSDSAGDISDSSLVPDDDQPDEAAEEPNNEKEEAGEAEEAEDAAEESGETDAEGGITLLGQDTAAVMASGTGTVSSENGQDAQSVETEENTIELADDIRVEGFVQTGEALTYTGGKITQNLRIYHNNTLLKENTDYRLTYKNNINAAASDGEKAPSVTITMKGQYSGSRTLYFTIAPRDIDADATQGYEQVIQYAKKLSIPVPAISCSGRRLANKKDFVCDYSTLPTNYTQGDAYEDGKVYNYTIRGIGNYTGSFTMQVAVIKDKTLNFGTAAVSVDKKQYAYHGKALSNEDVQITSVKIGKVLLDSSLYSYSVYAQTAGTGYVEIYPSDAGRAAGYRGFKKINIKVVGDRSIQDAAVGENWADSLTFSGQAAAGDGICQQSEGLLLYPASAASGEDGLTTSEVLREGVDYTVKYSNHRKVGTATVIFTGMGRYTGTLKKTYKILPNINLSIKWQDTDEYGNPTAVYRKGGAEPAFELVEMSGSEEVCVLKNKTDYTVKLADNKAPGIMTCTITGKGNYKGYQTTTSIPVSYGDIAQGTISVSDKPYSTRTNAWKSTVTITDANGKRLAAGTDYDKTLAYDYDGMENGLPPQAGTTVHVTAKGIKNYAGSTVTGNYRIYSISVSKLVIKIDAQEYTGQEITLASDAIHVYADQKAYKAGREMEESCYEITGYSSNIKAGTAKVMLRGTGSYGGTRTCTFIISPMTLKTSNIVRITSFALDTEAISQYEGTEYQLAAVDIQPAEGDCSTIRWESANPEIASVDDGGKVSLKKAGMTVVTASSYDGQTAVKCLVTVMQQEDSGAPEGDYVTPQQYRQAEDADDTAAFNRAIQSLKGKYGTLYVPAGTYYIDAETGVRLANHLQLVMSPDAVLKAVGNDKTNYNILLVQEVTGVSISGGKIVGERYEHTGGKGEWGHGIGIYDCSVITITDVDISECWGDGIYIGTNRQDANTNKEAGCRNVKIKNSSLHNNRRNNMSIVCGDEVTIDGCTLNNARGTDPEYGLDIESNYPDNPCEDITISNSSFTGNGKGSIGINSSWISAKPSAKNVRIENCTLNGHFINYAGENVVLSGSRLNGETDARMGVSLEDGTVINDGSSEEDVLVASYSASDFRITGDYSFSLRDLSTDGKSVLEKGVTYRFEYTVKGSGTWGIRTSQTSGYPCLPSTEQSATGIVTYQAGAARTKPCQITLYAEEQTADMWLQIDSLEIYKVK